MVQTFRSFTRIFSIFLLVSFFAATIHISPAVAAEGAARSVAVLPFEMHAPASLAYLQDGLRAMLASRLAANGGAVIIEQGKIDSLLQDPGKPMLQSEAVALARQLGADYIVTGGLTSLGGAMSIDARVIASDESSEPLNFYASAPQENEVIGAINQLSWDIAAKVFGATPPAAAAPTRAAQHAPAAEADPMAAFKTEHPDRAIRSGGAAPWAHPLS